MKIVIFTENNKCGGMDTFYSTVVNYWPHEDEFVFVCNKSHPCASAFKKFTKSRHTVIKHNIPLNWVVADRILFWLPKKMRRLTYPLFRLALYPVQITMLKKLFNEIDADRILVVNGGYPAGETCRLASIAWVKTGRKAGVHNIRNFAIPERPILRRYEEFVDKNLNECVSYFVGVSKVCANSLKIRKQFKDNDNIKHIYNGIDLNARIVSSDIRLREKFNIQQDAPVCIMLANYELRKGFKFLFEVMSKVKKEIPNIHLVIFGGGSKREIETVEKLKNNIAPDVNIYLHDFVLGARDLISQADILLISSQELESFGWTAIEGMLAKKPVVSTNIGGLPEVVGTDNACGYCVDKTNTNDFARNIVNIINDNDLAISLGENGWDRVHKYFTAERMAMEYSILVRE